MAILKRSKSQKVKDVRVMVEPTGSEKAFPNMDFPREDLTPTKDKRRSRMDKRQSIFGRSRSASTDARRSIERPMTAPSQDDCPLHTINETIDIREGGDTFSFPTPSPRLPPPRSATFQIYPSPLTVGNSPGLESPAIGIALGSPSQGHQLRGRTFTSETVPRSNLTRPEPARAHTTIPERMAVSPMQPELRRKKSGWKTLGNLFQRRPSKSAVHDPFYKVQHPSEASPLPNTRLLLDSPAQSPRLPQTPGNPSSLLSHHSQNTPMHRGMARLEARADMDSSSFMPPVDGNARPALSAGPPAQREAPFPQFKSQVRDSQAMFDQVRRKDTLLADSNPPTPGASSMTPRTPRLELDIPSGEFERYSVMFEKLLEPRQSILERRQSKAKKSSGAKSGEVSSQRQAPKVELFRNGIPQRSATSPHLKKVPSLRIKVATQEGRDPSAPVTAIHRPRPIQRSKTAPPSAVSPVARNFSRPAGGRTPAPVVVTSDSDAGSTLFGENSLPPTPTTTTTDADDVAVLAHDLSIRPPAHLRQRSEDEPSWEMLTSKPLVTVPSPHHSETGKPLYPRLKSPEDLERQIVQVSVARQVSVSRARRRVERAAESKQPLKPKVVELNGKNRKSTVVLIEGGDD